MRRRQLDAITLPRTGTTADAAVAIELGDCGEAVPPRPPPYASIQGSIHSEQQYNPVVYRHIYITPLQKEQDTSIVRTCYANCMKHAIQSFLPPRGTIILRTTDLPFCSFIQRFSAELLHYGFRDWSRLDIPSLGWSSSRTLWLFSRSCISFGSSRSGVSFPSSQ